MTAVKREAYFDTTPEHTDKSAIEHLANIVEALRNCADPHNERKSNMYRYKDSPDREVTVEMDFDFKVDGVIANPGTYEGGSKAIPLASAQTAVVMGFTNGDTPKKIYKVRFSCYFNFIPVLMERPRNDNGWYQQQTTS